MKVDLDMLGFAFAVLSSMAALWWRLHQQQREGEQRLTAEIARVEREISAFKLMAAEKYASHDALRDALKPLLDELHGLRVRFDKLIDRQVNRSD